MSAPAASRLVQTGAEASRPAGDQKTALHVYTLLYNAGLSEADILDVGDELWRRINERVARMAASANAEERVRYLEGFAAGSTPEQKRRGAAYRVERNKEIVAEEFLALNFNRTELAAIGEGLKAGLVPIAGKTGRRFAKVRGIDGRTQKFEVFDRPVHGDITETLLKNLETGEVIHV